MLLRSTVALVLVVLTATDQTHGAQPNHDTATEGLKTWTDAKGRSIRATLVAIAKTHVVLQRDDGKWGTVATRQLSDADRQFVVLEGKETSAAQNAKERLNQVKRILAQSIVKETEEKLIRENTATEQRTRTKTVRRFVERLYLEKYCYRGRVCTRWCRRIVPVLESVEETYQVEVQRLESRTILDSPDDPSVGTGRSTIELIPLPAAAGGRASKIFSASQAHLPLSIVQTTSDVDRALVAESTAFTERVGDQANEEKVKLVATVLENDKKIEVVVLLAVRDKASGILTTDTASLDQLAQALADQIAQDLPQ